ncbi:MAG: SHOCT domain-containing protein [Actinomycetales bacterium]|nr:SHOCT domain-containing protein [Actinomycetales bacterium]
MMWNNGTGMGWGMWLVMGSGALAFWLVVILVIPLTAARPHEGQHGAATDPLTLLKEALARGEVSVEEYEHRRRILSDIH